MAKVSKNEALTISLLGLAYGFAFYDRMMMTFLTPYVVPEFDLSNTQVGALGAALSLTWAIGAFVLGLWSDRLGVRKPFIIASLVIFSSASILSGLSWDFWTLLASRLLMGLVEGPFLPVCLAVIAAASPITRRGLNTGIVQNVFGALLGTALAPIIAVWIAESWGWRYAFYTAGIPGFLLALLIWRLLKEPPAPVKELEKKPTVSIRHVLAQRNIAICSAISCLLVGSVVLGSIFLPLYLVQERGFSTAQMAMIMATLGLCPPVGGILIPWLSDRIGRRPPMIIFGALTALTPLCAVVFDGPFWMLIGLMFIGWIGLGTFPLFMGVIPSETLAARGTATAMGVVVAIGELTGGVAAPLVTGHLADQYGPAIPLLCAMVMSLAAGITSVFLRETNIRVRGAVT